MEVVAAVVGIAVGDARESSCGWLMRDDSAVLCQSSRNAQECQGLSVSLTLSQSILITKQHRPCPRCCSTPAVAGCQRARGRCGSARVPSPSSSTAPHLRHVVGKQVRAIETQVRLAQSYTHPWSPTLTIYTDNTMAPRPNLTGFDPQKFAAAAGQPANDPWARAYVWIRLRTLA